jgi:phosphoesterase RecJ-like protein
MFSLHLVIEFSYGISDSKHMNKIQKKFKSAIEQANNIVITTHSYPDADGIGSEISLCMALKKLGKKAICCNDVELLQRYKYLDPGDIVVGVDRLKENFPVKPDLIIVVDTNIIDRTGHEFLEYYNQYKPQLLYIDHHPCPQEKKDNHCIDTSAAATGQLIGELIQSLGLEFDEKMALPLYTAILIDTSSFRYPTVTAKTHELIAKLLATGIKPPRAYNGIYGTKKIEHMHLLSKVLASANSNSTEEIAWLVLKKEELIEFDIDIEDTHGFINHLLILDNVKVACMFRDDGTQVKVSLRSSGEYDVGLIAISLGGGGHSHSAATVIDKKENYDLPQIISDVIKQIESKLLEV